ncbi:MAG: SDR family NAD(P)-dependent oxidoreductase [Phycisphaeraceae bacterium]|nr:MAG: SDR family NAD(P)-dependent oxidoreductase [Phycisphaeraceae bacterium]
MNDHLLKGRIGIVTGASAGIGAAAARHLVRHGCPVVLNARRKDRLDALLGELGAEDASTIAGDCADPEIIAALFDSARDEFGGHEREADLVVVNAGRGLSGSVVTSDASQWEEMVRTNLLGAARLIREAARRMTAQIDRDRSKGLDWTARPHDIVVLGSTVGRHISPFSSMYGSTKFAVNSLAEAARREMGPKGVRVTLIEPGFVESEFQGVAGYERSWFEEVRAKIGPVLSPDDIADLICTITGKPAHVHWSDVVVRCTRQEYP